MQISTLKMILKTIKHLSKELKKKTQTGQMSKKICMLKCSNQRSINKMPRKIIHRCTPAQTTPHSTNSNIMLHLSHLNSSISTQILSHSTECLFLVISDHKLTKALAMFKHTTLDNKIKTKTIHQSRILDSLPNTTRRRIKTTYSKNENKY